MLDVDSAVFHSAIYGDECQCVHTLHNKFASKHLEFCGFFEGVGGTVCNVLGVSCLKPLNASISIKKTLCVGVMK